MNSNHRIGRGTDRHRFVEDRPLILGGVDIPHSKGLLGHSDADALLHAVSDALLGAMALGDIGTHFPDTDDANKDLDSKKILSHCLSQVSALNWTISNVDIVIHTEQPKIGPHRQALRESLASLLSCEIDQISIKAKTAEGLGPVGEGLCLDAEAIVLLHHE